MLVADTVAPLLFLPVSLLPSLPPPSLRDPAGEVQRVRRARELAPLTHQR